MAVRDGGVARGDRPLRPVRARQRHARRADRGGPRRLSRRRGHRLLPVRAGDRPCPPRCGRRRRHADRPPAGARALGRPSPRRCVQAGLPAEFRHQRLGPPVRRTRAARDLVGVRPPRRRRLRRHRAAGGRGPGGGRTGPGSERAGAAGRRGPASTEPAPGIHLPESSPTPRRPAGVSPIHLSWRRRRHEPLRHAARSTRFGPTPADLRRRPRSRRSSGRR